MRVKEGFETLSTLLVIVAASAVLWTTFARPARPSGPPTVEDVDDVIAASYLTNVLGNGAVAVIEFTDFQCPFCKRHVDEVFATVKKEFIDSGKIRDVVMHNPLAWTSQHGLHESDRIRSCTPGSSPRSL